MKDVKGDQQAMISIRELQKTYLNLKKVVNKTPLMYNLPLSEEFQCEIFLKREDLQIVRSYKLRGAYNKISSLTDKEKKKGIVCASAGNHAQGVAYSCYKLGIKGKIFMPVTTPKQKIKQVRLFGKDQVEVILIGDTYDDAEKAALSDCKANKQVFIHPFDDRKVIAGQGTIGVEILEDADKDFDYLFAPVGGGGLICGVGSYFKQMSASTKIIGAEPLGAPAMKNSLEAGKVVSLTEIEKFVDGAAVKRVGDHCFEIANEVIDEMILVPEGKICSDILKLYNEQAIVVEPAGALSISVLDQFRDQIKGKRVVCIVSGSNNDITRTEEIRERSLLYEGLKHYFVLRLPQRPGALKEFCNEVLGPTDDICLFEYIRKHNKSTGSALLGIELAEKKDLMALIQRFDQSNFQYERLNNKPNLFELLI